MRHFYTIKGQFLHTGISILIIFLIMGSFTTLNAQEKKSPRLQLEYHSTDDGTFLRTRARYREGRKYEPVQNAQLQLYFLKNDQETLIGKVKTGEDGWAEINVSPEIQSVMDTSENYQFLVLMEENDEFEEADRDLEIAKAILELELFEEDSIREIVARLMKVEEGDFVPVESEEVKFYVKRLFSLLPIGGQYTFTDEEGEVRVPFPADLPGDKEGNVEIVVRIQDHDDFGNLQASKKVDWGKPLEVDKNFEKRTLWASRDKTPYWLLIIPNLMILGIWGIIVVLILNMMKISKIGKIDN